MVAGGLQKMIYGGWWSPIPEAWESVAWRQLLLSSMASTCNVENPVKENSNENIKSNVSHKKSEGDIIVN